MNTQKIIEILDPQAGTIRETVGQSFTGPVLDVEQLFAARRNGHRITLQEAATTNEFPVILRDGIRSITFDSYARVPTTWQEWAMTMPSDKQSENWVEENDIGELPVVPEGTAFPEFKLDLDRTLEIRNQKRGGIISVTEEMIKFNRLNILKRHAEKMGRAAARTREVACYSVATTGGNYNRTTADNDIGNNTAATTFSATGLNTAMTVLRTMKDRKTGSYLGVNPDTLLVTPRLEMAVKQLLLSPFLIGPSDAVTAQTYGTGTTNPFRGVVNRIIVSPRVGSSYQWVLMEAKQAVILQEVEGLQILQESAGRVEHEGYFVYDHVRYRVRDWFGVGMLNDRYSYYSSSTTAPAVD